METNFSTSQETIQLLQQTKLNQFDLIFKGELDDFEYEVIISLRELIIWLKLPNNHYYFLRPISSIKFSKNEIENSSISQINSHDIAISFELHIGKLSIDLTYQLKEDCLIQCTNTTLELKQSLIFNPYLRDSLISTAEFKLAQHRTHYFEQTEGRSGYCFGDFGKGQQGCFLYWQDLGALKLLCQDTESSLKDTVRIGTTPFGFLFPTNQKVLKAKKKYVLHRSYVVYHRLKPKSTEEINRLFFSLMKAVYPSVEQPKKTLHSFRKKTQQSLYDLSTTFGCWKQVNNFEYLNAYMNSYDSPAESMVQSAILKPLFGYNALNPSVKTQDIISKLSTNLTSFFDDELGTFHRWLPSESYLLDFEEEHQRSFIMDSWYLHYPILQLAYLFESGFEHDTLHQMFIDSLSFLKKLAKNYNYEWPILFNIYTLEIIKNESDNQHKGQKDMVGLYMLIMLKAYALTKNKSFLNEAKYAGNKALNFGLNDLYQSNNTAYTAEAYIELAALSNESKYLKVAEICLGNIIRNCAIWHMDYGNSTNRHNFFSLFPLKTGSYTAAFEEHETLTSFHRIIYAIHKNQISLMNEIVFFMVEYIQHALPRLPYYYPPTLPSDIFADQIKTGFILKNKWIPVEDLGDGWNAVGAIGQEVYGAALFFNLSIYHELQAYDKIIGYSSLPFFIKNNIAVEINFLGANHQEGLLKLFPSIKHRMKLTLNNKRIKLENVIRIKTNDCLKIYKVN